MEPFRNVSFFSNKFKFFKKKISIVIESNILLHVEKITE